MSHEKALPSGGAFPVSGTIDPSRANHATAEDIMLGAIAGDIICSIYERHNTARYDVELFTKQSTFTDDTVMTVAMMDHILSRADLADTISKWYSRYPRRGYGPAISPCLSDRAVITDYYVLKFNSPA